MGGTKNCCSEGCTLFSEEFRLKNFSMQISAQELAGFGDSALIGHKKFSMYRGLIALYIVALFWWSWGNMISVDQTWYWFIYLTHWTLMIEVVYLVLAAAVSFKMDEIRSSITDPSAEDVKAPTIVKVTWVFMNLVYSTSFLVFLMYWVLVYDGDTTIVSVQVHGVNFILMAVDVFLNGSPFKILHFYQPVCYGLIYTTFNLMYYFGGGKSETGTSYVYSALDWGTDPSTACFWALFLPLVGVPLFHSIFWWWWHLGNVCSSETSEWRTNLLKNENKKEQLV